MIIECEYDPSKEDEKFLEFCLSTYFPYYYFEATVNHNEFIHHLIVRNKVIGDPGIVNSEVAVPAKKLFDRFCKLNNIKYQTIFRASINCTTHKNDRYGDIHMDHEFPHYNFIMYLNDCSGNTYIFDNDNNIVKEIEPKKNRVVVFDGMKHAQGFCKPKERRVVLVITFR